MEVILDVIQELRDVMPPFFWQIGFPVVGNGQPFKLMAMLKQEHASGSTGSLQPSNVSRLSGTVRPISGREVGKETELGTVEAAGGCR